MSFPAAGGLTITVPPGAVSSPTRVEADTDQPAPASTFGQDVREIGRPYTIVSAAPLPGARVTVPVDLRQVGQSRRADVFLAVYSDELQVWVPLPTDLDVGAGTLSVTAPHFSKYQAFGYDIPSPGQVADTIGWAGEETAGFAHDVWGGVKKFTSGMLAGLGNWWSGPALKRPDCGQPAQEWTVASAAQEITGCVTGDPALALQVGNTYRVPFAITVPAGSDIGLKDSDGELDLVDALMRAADHATGRGYVAPRGRTSIGIPTGSDGLPTRLEPDQLSTALSVIVGMLSFLPGKKVFTDEVGQTVMVTIWDAAKTGEPLAQIIVDVRASLTRTVEKGPRLDATEKIFDAASCVLKDLEGGAGAARDGDPEKVAESIVEIAKECTGTVLEAGDSAFKEVWQHIKGLLDGAQAVRTVLDGIKLGLTHFGGQIDLRASHVEPVLGNPPNPDYVTHGYGEVRPPVIDNGGDGNGVVTDIEWDSWGGPQAHGHGTAPWVPPGAPLAEGVDQPAEVVAFDLGTCQGRLMYRGVTWFFPQHGDTFDPSSAHAGCS